MAYYYAQLDEDNVCVGLSQLSGEVDLPDMIEMSEAEHESGGILGRKYENGEWVEVAQEIPPPNISKEDMIMLALADIYEKLEEI